MSTLSLAIVFLVLAILCGIFGFGFLSGILGCFAKGLFICFFIGFILSLIIKGAPTEEELNDHEGI
jgi:uncharacterized membrane protein YtjA (UPF0391 family)